MSISSKLHHIRRLLVAALVLPLFGACSYIYDDGDDCDDMITPQIATANHYINLKIVVSSGKENTTRADGEGENGATNTTTTTPAGGEDGDGRETGYKRENEVTGITLMLYKAESNASAESNVNIENNSTLAFVRYYPVKLVEPRKDGGQEIGDTEKKYEAVYTTGNQSLADSELDLNAKYRAIVVANRNMEPAFEKDDDVKDVCDNLVSAIYTGTGLGVKAENFVMSSVKNNLIEFSAPKETIVDGKTTQVYSFDDIYIQRLAARVDFWTNNATYNDAAETDNTPGYEYSVVKNGGQPSSDKFVLTAVTPFNLYNGDEYLIKRFGDSNATPANTIYFGKEPDNYKEQENYVLDPKTATDKTDAGVPSYMTYALDNIIYDPAANIQTMAMERFKEGDLTDALCKTESTGEADNFIVCYPKENTLLEDSPLYYYATGLRIEGDYYEEGWEKWTATETEKENPYIQHLTYYGFLRHQGENSGKEAIYQIWSEDELKEKKEKGTLVTDLKSEFPMNFGVVRNNIYRISIDRITEKRDIQLRIVVKKWDTFTHDVIYM